jgi:glutamate N-acetyltransferase/amino-acid N-acetyltransferase
MEQISSSLSWNGIELTTIEQGGVASALGFRAGGIHAGFRKDPDRLDMALVEAEELAAVAATFTQNVFCAAPVIVSKEHLDGRNFGFARAVIINSGCANAATGSVGLDAANRTCDIVASAIGCSVDDVLVASTGVIGQILDTTPFETAVPALHQSMTCETGADAARAIMTTDTVPKQIAVSYVSEDPALKGATITVGGMAKGSGMIMPNMATMIAVITTDAPLEPALLHTTLVHSVDRSFNKVTVDSDTSTNDTCFLFASGRAALHAHIEEGSIAYREFQAALDFITQDLARKMARDGEGATKLVTVKVSGARTPEEADMAARCVANSPLVKTAIFGHDANWGRIAGALGRSGAQFEQQNVSIDIMGIPVCRDGLTVEFDEEEALRRFEEPEILLAADLGAGDAQTTVWTCDFSYDYVRINGDYRT